MTEFEYVMICPWAHITMVPMVQVTLTPVGDGTATVTGKRASEQCEVCGKAGMLELEVRAVQP